MPISNGAKKVVIENVIEKKNAVKDNIRNSNNTTTQSSPTPKWKSKKYALSSECENSSAKDSKNTTKSLSMSKTKSKKWTLSQECISSCDTEIINNNSNVTTEITSPIK